MFFCLKVSSGRTVLWLLFIFVAIYQENSFFSSLKQIFLLFVTIQHGEIICSLLTNWYFVPYNINPKFNPKFISSFFSGCSKFQRDLKLECSQIRILPQSLVLENIHKSTLKIMVNTKNDSHMQKHLNGRWRTRIFVKTTNVRFNELWRRF